MTSLPISKDSRLALRNSKGFTLIEILVVMGIITFAFIIGAFADLSNIKRNSINTEQANLIAILQRARGRAMNNIDNADHTVHLDPLNYTIDSDPPIPRDDSIALDFSDTGADIVFEQLSGNSATPGTIKLGADEREITITEIGLVEW